MKSARVTVRKMIYVYIKNLKCNSGIVTIIIFCRVVKVTAFMLLEVENLRSLQLRFSSSVFGFIRCVDFLVCTFRY